MYLDFETDTKGEFFLVGSKFEGVFEQTVLNSNLLGLANHHQLSLKSPSEFFEHFCSWINDDTVIVGYSVAEREILNRLCDPKRSYDLMNLKYLNLLRLAKVWIKKYRQEDFSALTPFRRDPNRWGAKSLPNSLASIMRLTDFHAPSDYAPGKTSSKFKAVISALEKREQKYELLTSKQKKKATECLKHNRFDVEAMPILMNNILSYEENLLTKYLKPMFANGENN